MAWPFIGTLGGQVLSDATAPSTPGIGNFFANVLSDLRSKRNTDTGFPLLDLPAGYPRGPGTNQAFTTLTDILSRQGKTDPLLFNQQLNAIQRGTQSQQGAARGELARLGPGMQQSGVGQALMAALGQGGEAMKSQAIATENAAAEQRMREDLILWLQMFVNPALDADALRRGMQMANRQYDSQQNAALLGALSSLGGSLIGNWGTLFPKKTTEG